MKKQFSLDRNTAIINFSSHYCDTSEMLLNSSGFKRVLKTYIKQIEKKETSVFLYLNDTFKGDRLDVCLTDLFKLLLVLEIEDIMNLDQSYKTVFKNKLLLIEFIEEFYNYWRRLERYSIVSGKNHGEGIQKTKFIEANNNFSNLVLRTYRTINEKIHGQKHRVYRQLIAGANAGLIVQKIPWIHNNTYKKLGNIPFIESIVLNPPFITYPKRNKRSGIFNEVSSNPIENILFDQEKWFCYPAKVGHSLAYIFFHKDFMSLGVTLANLFELASIDACKDQKPDLLYVFGNPDDDPKTVFYHDKENDMMIGYASYHEDYDYFGYMKKMILTLHNVRMIEQGQLPIHGAMVSVILKNGQKKNIVIIGDSGAGKSESLEALRVIGDQYIKDMKVIFDDMGTFAFKDNQLLAYGTEIGAFIRLDDLEIGYAYREIDRSIFMNPDKVNARVVIPVSTYQDIIEGHQVDMVLYANNYENQEELIFFNQVDEAIDVFKTGARVAKGTTTEDGLVKSYFANPFGPVQRQKQTNQLITDYFNYLFNNKIPVGEIRTKLAIDGYEQIGPQSAARKLFEYIKREV